jgi:hypothetical protein
VFLIENDKRQDAKKYTTRGKASKRNNLVRGNSYDSFLPRNNFVNSGLK